MESIATVSHEHKFTFLISFNFFITSKKKILPHPKGTAEVQRILTLFQFLDQKWCGRFYMHKWGKTHLLCANSNHILSPQLKCDFLNSKAPHDCLAICLMKQPIRIWAQIIITVKTVLRIDQVIPVERDS